MYSHLAVIMMVKNVGLTARKGPCGYSHRKDKLFQFRFPPPLILKIATGIYI
jgi:hypothetical protein